MVSRWSVVVEHSQYTPALMMLKTGGMRGRREVKQDRLAEDLEGLSLLERDRDWPRVLLCSLVFEGDMAMGA